MSLELLQVIKPSGEYVEKMGEKNVEGLAKKPRRAMNRRAYVEMVVSVSILGMVTSFLSLFASLRLSWKGAQQRRAARRMLERRQWLFCQLFGSSYERAIRHM